MSKTFSVIRREYGAIIKKKSFIVSTLLIPLVMGLSMVLPLILARTEPDEQRRIGLVDATESLYPDLVKALSDTLNDGRRRYLIVSAPADTDTLDLVNLALSSDVEEGRLHGFLVVKADFERTRRVNYCAKHVTNFTELARLESALSGVLVERSLRREGLDPQRVRELTKGVSLSPLRLTSPGEGNGRTDQPQTENEIGGAFVTMMIFVMILFMTVMVYGVSVMRGIIEDKTRRIVEVLLSSLSPFQLMMGKLLGIGAAGLTQSAIWIVLAAAVSVFLPEVMQLPVSSGAVPMNLLAYFLAFYLLGYFLYASIYAIVGAVCSSEQDAQNIQFPIILLLMVPLTLNLYVVQNPSSTVSVVLSLVPFFAPVLMFLRINVLYPPLWQVILCLVILAGSIVATTWLAARVFRVGILMYGKRATLGEVVAWIRHG